MKKLLYSLGIILLGMTAYIAYKKDSPLSITKGIRLAILTDPFSFDPRVAVDVSSQSILQGLFEGLMRIDKQGNLAFGMARFYEVSKDKKTYTFFLKNNFWSNGEPLTAHHFEQAWKKILSPSFFTKVAFLFYPIKNAKQAKEGRCSLDEVGIHTIDDYTLQVSLQSPTEYFLHLLTNPCFSPGHESNDLFFANHNASTLLSNGPFTLSFWKPKNTILFVKNPYYWESSVIAIDTISFSIISDPTTALSLFENREIDLVDSTLVSIEAIPDLQKRSTCLQAIDCLAMLWLPINVQSYPLNHIKIRKALSLAIDKPYIIQHFYHGEETPATSIVPRKLQLRPSSSLPYFSLKAAQDLFNEALQEMNLTLETFPKITILGLSSHKHMQILQILQQQWQEKLGIKVEIEINDPKTTFDKIFHLNYQIALFGWASYFNDPIYNLGIFGSSFDITGWNNTKYQELLEQSNEELDSYKRKQILYEAEEYILEEMPIIPLFDTPYYFLVNDRIKNLTFNSFGKPIFTYVQIE